MDDVRGQHSRDSVEEDETYDVERSLRDSLEYQAESGRFLKDFILKENNKVNYTLFFPVLILLSKVDFFVVYNILF